MKFAVLAVQQSQLAPTTVCNVNHGVCLVREAQRQRSALFWHSPVLAIHPWEPALPEPLPWLAKAPTAGTLPRHGKRDLRSPGVHNPILKRVYITAVRSGVPQASRGGCGLVNGNPVKPSRVAIGSWKLSGVCLLRSSDAQLLHSKRSVPTGKGEKLSALQSLEGH